MKQAGAFEREIASWFDQLRAWADARERFTLITMLLAIAPSPPAVVLASALAALQLYLCKQGRIPRSEAFYLGLALGIALLNLVVTILLYQQLIQHAGSMWNFWHPLGWPFWLLQRNPQLSDYLQSA